MSILPKVSRHAEPDDPLAITPERLHQYYRTVQAEEPAEGEIDAAMARRRKRGRANRNRRSGHLRWAFAWVLLILLAGFWVLSS